MIVLLRVKHWIFQFISEILFYFHCFPRLVQFHFVWSRDILVYPGMKHFQAKLSIHSLHSILVWSWKLNKCTIFKQLPKFFVFFNSLLHSLYHLTTMLLPHFSVYMWCHLLHKLPKKCSSGVTMSSLPFCNCWIGIGSSAHLSFFIFRHCKYCHSLLCCALHGTLDFNFDDCCFFSIGWECKASISIQANITFS